MTNKDEIWKDVPNYEGCYQASNLGRIRSLDRTIIYSDGREFFYKGGLMAERIYNGYKTTSLYKNGNGRTLGFSQVVAMTFLGHKPNGRTIVVDHINGDKLDNKLENLRIVTQRENISTCFRSDRELLSSKCTGVSFDDRINKWSAQIHHKGISARLGCFEKEITASRAYQGALSKIKDGTFNHDDYKRKCASKYKGVSFNSKANKWFSYIRIGDKTKHIGYFTSETEAHKARQSYIDSAIFR